MVSDGAKLLMRRKAGDGRESAQPEGMTPPRALRAAVPRAGEGAASIPAAALAVEEGREVRDALAEDLPEGALLSLLEGPGERFGAAILDPSALAALIEALTTGQVTAREVKPRRPTRTDAVVCADFLDALLDAFDGTLAEAETAGHLCGFRYAAPLADARAVQLALADGAYAVFRLTLDLGGGARQGHLTLAFPWAAAPKPSGGGDGEFERAMESNVLGAMAPIEAVLHRIRLPLSEVAGWQPGDLVPVPLAALAGVSLEAGSGPALAEARLGQQGGHRAVRITRLAGTAPDRDAADAAEFEEAAAPVPRRALPLVEDPQPRPEAA